ncbi:hypothetical protein PGTUg99_002600 [Puccinia graminis f. sp. tritici]|uniref:Uncharacterized protein n=1 Tax=Puccinia graminis f. sp. tritici TaxID=56615 RepID=A0A5B0SD64_PUCGR|nr:hypothetical protein PGTUg99_002600 [Puccinia graminis f. sp. tritici]
MSTPDESSMEQSAIILKQQAQISKMEEMMQGLQDTVNLLLKQNTPQQVPIPETPPVRESRLRFATSTPFDDRTQGLDTTIGAGDDSFFNSEGASPSSQGRPKTSIKLPDEQKGVMLDAKKTNLHFDGTEVEVFIRRVEKVAFIQNAGTVDLAFQLPLIINNKKISEAIEQMEGHETGDWELLKKELTRKWGRATPFRKYREDAIPRLVQKAQEGQGIKTRLEYRKFVGELEEMTDYFTRMGYSHLNPDSGNPLWSALSAELKKEVTKELAHAKKLKKTKDGRNIIPELDILKEYVELALIIIDFDEDEPQTSSSDATKKKVKIQDPAETEELKETIKKLNNSLEYQARAAPPHLNRPSSPGFGDTRPRFTAVECFYCKEKHMLSQCEAYTQDMQDRRMFRYQGVYYYPNRQPIVVDKDCSVKEMVKRFHDEQSNSRTENTAVQESTSAVIEVEEWGSWLPSQANISEEELQNNIGFGLRKSQRIQDKNPQASSQPMPVKTQESVSKTPPPNQEAIKPPTRRKSFPGSWLEEEELEEEESSKQKSTGPSRENPKQSREELRAKEITIEPLDKSIRNKFYKQTYTLTLEEIVKIAPQFLQGLQESRPEYDGSEKKANNVELHCSTGLGTSEDEEERGLTYACPVGMQISLG